MSLIFSKLLDPDRGFFVNIYVFSDKEPHLGVDRPGLANDTVPIKSEDLFEAAIMLQRWEIDNGRT